MYLRCSTQIYSRKQYSIHLEKIKSNNLYSFASLVLHMTHEKLYIRDEMISVMVDSAST
jgi:hypothetical protein